MAHYHRILASLVLCVAASVGTSTASAQTISLTVANGIASSVPTHWWFKDFIGPELEKRSEGKIKANVQVNGTVCSEHECVEQVSMGYIDIGSVSAGNIGSFGNVFDILNLPYIFKDDAAAEMLVNGWLGKELAAQAAEKMNLHILAIIPSYSFRNIGNRIREIRAPSDLDGIKIRVTKSPVEFGLIKAWGGVAVPFDWSQLYEGLSTGVVDGFYIPTAYVAAQKFHEVAGYLTKTGGGWNAHIIFMGKDRYNKLPDWAKEVIDGISSDIRKESFKVDAEWEAKMADRLGGKLNIYAPTDEELKLWYKGAVDVWPTVKNTYDKNIARRVLEEQGQTDLIKGLEEVGAL